MQVFVDNYCKTNNINIYYVICLEMSNIFCRLRENQLNHGKKQK